MAPPRHAGAATPLPGAAGWSASAFVAAVLARLIREALELQADLDGAAAGHLRRLEALLPAVWLVLDAADAGAVDAGARPLRDLLDAACDADDALDDIAIERALPGAARRGKAAAAAAVARKPRSPLRFLLCFSPPSSAGASAHGGKGSSSSSSSKNTSIDMDGLRDALESMARAAYRCASAYEHVEPRTSYTTRIEDDADADAAGEAEQDVEIFGRDAEIDKILETMRLSDDPHYRLRIGVLAVAGVAGVGKTALARFVFHHAASRAEFAVRAWVHVAGALRPRKQLVDQMVRAILGHEHDVSDGDAGRELLVERLAGKRILLVLDDVADVAADRWGDLMEALRPAARQSLIMVTTQSEAVATAIATTATLTLEPLEFTDYFKMFKHFAFGDADEGEECTVLGDDDNVEEELSPAEQAAAELAKKMAGLPLPARAIGRALHSRRADADEASHWNSVLENELWDVAGEVSPALWLSYRHLDPRLKQCFAYCAVFPGDHAFGKEELVQMWVAQGYVYSDRAAARLEDVGGEFFDELVRRCFFQPIGDNKYVVHNLMQEMARAVATSRFFTITEISADVPQDVHHLTVRTTNLSKLKNDLALLQISPPLDHHVLHQVRTVLFFADFSNESDEFSEFLAELFAVAKSVRVLGLARTGITNLPEEIGLLRRLRYLDLSGNRIDDLPETLCQLHLLQVLDVRCNSPSLHAPNGVTSLIHLRHLHASELFLSSISRIHALSELQELDAFRVGGSAKISALQRMTQLHGTLRISDLRRVDASEMSKGILKGMQHLNALHLSWSGSSSDDDQSKDVSKDEDVLEWMQPHERLRDLRITGCGGVRSPSWMIKQTSSYLWNVTSLYLTDCMNWKVLPPLHVLPSLEILGIKGMRSINKVSTIPQRSDQELFPKLKRLVLEGAPHCAEWSTGSSSRSRRTTAFPSLCELEIRNCPSLTTFPDLPLSLTTMIVENAGFKTLPRIQDWQPSSEEAALMAGSSSSSSGRWTSRLTTLQVHQCHKLRSLASGLLQQQHLLKSLELLSIKNCDDVVCDIA
ncbi:hypothetical protein ACP4OV_016423 [Aristida adscensionis]